MPGTASYAERMDRLLRTRAAQRPLPDGFLRCPLNPLHEIPIANIAAHMEKAHAQDALAIAPGAMYSSGTMDRRCAFLEAQRSRGDLKGRSRRRHVSSSHASSSLSSSSSSSSSSYSSSSSSDSSGSSVSMGIDEYRRVQRPRRELPSDPKRTVRNVLPHAEVCALPNAIPTAGKERAAGSVLFGQYPLGHTIGHQAIMDFLHTFGPLRRCDFHPQRASFTVEYDSPAPALQCGAAVQTFVVDGVNVTLRAMQNSMPYDGPHVPPPQPPPNPNPYPMQCSVLPAHPIIKVAGKPIGVAVLQDNTPNGGTGIREKPCGPISPRDVVVAGLSGTKPVDERRVWEEFSRFGTVTHFTVAGPRVVVEFAAPESAEKASRALRSEKQFTCCFPLK